MGKKSDSLVHWARSAGDVAAKTNLVLVSDNPGNTGAELECYLRGLADGLWLVAATEETGLIPPHHAVAAAFTAFLEEMGDE